MYKKNRAAVFARGTSAPRGVGAAGRRARGLRLIDFGLARRVVDAASGEHVAPRATAPTSADAPARSRSANSPAEGPYGAAAGAGRERVAEGADVVIGFGPFHGP